MFSKKHIQRVSVFLFLILGIIGESLAQPGPPGGGPGGPPCWPPSTCDPAIPLNNELILLLTAGIGLGLYMLVKSKRTLKLQN